MITHDRSGMCGTDRRAALTPSDFENDDANVVLSTRGKGAAPLSSDSVAFQVERHGPNALDRGEVLDHLGRTHHGCVSHGRHTVEPLALAMSKANHADVSALGHQGDSPSMVRQTRRVAPERSTGRDVDKAVAIRPDNGQVAGRFGESTREIIPARFSEASGVHHGAAAPEVPGFLQVVRHRIRGRGDNDRVHGASICQRRHTGDPGCYPSGGVHADQSPCVAGSCEIRNGVLRVRPFPIRSSHDRYRRGREQPIEAVHVSMARTPRRSSERATMRR